mmetsp:Transcript_6725/g.14569  ORF Transcript_6725/g.14569 Transcript_6725/m.14569 type:complete len:200 (-) Transcript_6725:1107-1706(-)
MYRAREGCVYGYGLQVVEAAEVDGGAAVQRVARDAAHEALVPLDLVARVGVPRLHHAASRRVHSLYDDDDLHLSVAHEELHHLPLLRLPVGAAGPAAVVAAVAGACRGAAHLCQLPPKRLREEAVRGAAAVGGGWGGSCGCGARSRSSSRRRCAHLGGRSAGRSCCARCHDAGRQRHAAGHRGSHRRPFTIVVASGASE